MSRVYITSFCMCAILRESSSFESSMQRISSGDLFFHLKDDGFNNITQLLIQDHIFVMRIWIRLCKLPEKLNLHQIHVCHNYGLKRFIRLELERLSVTLFMLTVFCQLYSAQKILISQLETPFHAFHEHKVTNVRISLLFHCSRLFDPCYCKPHIYIVLLVLLCFVWYFCI